MKTKKYSVYNDSLARCEFLPASTFKLPNSLIALECGAVADENETIKWDGVHRYYDFWDRDYNLKDALANSTVWFYQEMARRIGAERMQHWLDKINYGNKNIGGGIDQFWLRGDLRITSYGQIDFLRRLYEDSLPFSKHSMEIVKRIMLKDSTRKLSIKS
jgi:beta-lactamase class D